MSNILKNGVMTSNTFTEEAGQARIYNTEIKAEEFIEI